MLRVVFPIAETGFDPQATSDLYPGHVQRGIFEPLFAYDYLARPYKLVPQTAAAMPEISPDGRTWTIRIAPGIVLRGRPAFKGKKRELTAQDYVFAWKRLLDPRVRSPYLWYLDGKLVGAEKVLAKAKEDGQARLRRGDRGSARARPAHAPAQARRARLRDAGLHDARRRCRRSRAKSWRRTATRSGWVMANPVGTGPLPAEGMASRPEDRPRGESALSRAALSDRRASRTTLR